MCSFDSTPVAKLPFEAHWTIRWITHLWLTGEDYTDCSVPFIFVLCAMVFRPILKKALGFMPPRGLPGDLLKMPGMEKVCFIVIDFRLFTETDVIIKYNNLQLEKMQRDLKKKRDEAKATD